MVYKQSLCSLILFIITYSSSLYANEEPSPYAVAHDLCERAKIAILAQKHDAAIVLLQDALTHDPQHARAHFYLASAYFNMQRYQDALNTYLTTAALLPNNVDLYCNLGVCANMLEKTDDAIAYFEQAITLNKQCTLAHLQLVASYEKAEQYPQALAACKRFLSLNPTHREALLSAGGLSKQVEQFEDAEWYFRTVYNQNNDDFQAVIELAAVLTTLEEYEEALTLYRAALQLRPQALSTFYNLGFTLKKLGYFDETIAIYKQVLAQKPDYALAHFSLGLTYLTTGNFQEGWQEYEWRWRAYNDDPGKFTMPRWDGSPLAGKSIYVQAEQGYGDTFQFVRYLKLLKEQGAHVIFAPQHALIPLIKLMPYIDEVTAHHETEPAADYYIPLLSLPLMCNTTRETVPVSIPYLYADQQLVEAWKGYFDTLPRGYRIGICWHGNSQYKDISLRRAVAQKSCPLHLFALLAEIPNVQLYSLQKVSGMHEIQALENKNFVTFFSDNFDTLHGRFMDTAAIITQLDLVITVDTSIAHLAAALGVETWNLLPEPADWRWMVETTETPWYPAMRLFRQPSRGDWHGLMLLVQEALYTHVATQYAVQQKENTLFGVVS